MSYLGEVATITNVFNPENILWRSSMEGAITQLAIENNVDADKEKFMKAPPFSDVVKAHDHLIAISDTLDFKNLLQKKIKYKPRYPQFLRVWDSMRIDTAVQYMDQCYIGEDGPVSDHMLKLNISGMGNQYTNSSVGRVVDFKITISTHAHDFKSQKGTYRLVDFMSIPLPLSYKGNCDIDEHFRHNCNIRADAKLPYFDMIVAANEIKYLPECLMILFEQIVRCEGHRTGVRHHFDLDHGWTKEIV